MSREPVQFRQPTAVTVTARPDGRVGLTVALADTPRAAAVVLDRDEAGRLAKAIREALA